MKLLTVSGPPSSGKTSVLVHVIKALRRDGKVPGVVKFDCLSTSDNEVFEALGVPVCVGLSGNLCPDHFFVSNIEECLDWGRREGIELLLCESAGLCNRCSPHIKGALSVCVIDNLMGLNSPKKIGPMLKYADIVAVTKGDIVSQAEREVFAFRVRQANPRARVLHVNGLTGQGAAQLAGLMEDAPVVQTLKGGALRFPMPAALCSYCLGETKIGKDFQVGNLRGMKTP